MSSHWLRLIPTDPDFVPDAAAAQTARNRLVEFARDVKVTFTGQPEFIHNGSNLARVLCPRCEAELGMSWWVDATERAYERRFADLRVVLPCCGLRTSLNDLNYDMPVGFACFVLDLIEPLDPSEPPDLDGLNELLGTPLRSIWAHI